MNALLTRTDFDKWTGRLVRRMRRRHNEHCTTILTWHSVAREETLFTAGTQLRHHPADFEHQIDYLAAHYNLISLHELVHMLEQEEQPRRTVVLTFDDGYADSLRVALPILFRRRIPMTIFPVTSVIGNSDLMWQHKLAWLIASGHESRVWNTLKDAGWMIPADPEPLATFVRRNYRATLLDVLESVLRDAGTNGPELAAQYRPYLEDEEIAAADPNFVSFGNHTHTHPVLASLTPRQQLGEIMAAQRKLLELTGRTPWAMAYPFGLRPHYNAESKRLARDTGHRAALDMRRRMNVGRVDPFELSRRPVPNGPQIGFEKMIESWPANARAPFSGGLR